MGPGPSLLKHPVLQAGAAVLVLLAVVAGVLTLVDLASGSPDNRTASTAGRDVTATPGTSETGDTGPGMSGTTKTTVAVRSLPGDRTPVFGTLPEGSAVQVDGRSGDSQWLRVIFPPDSDLRGWVAADEVVLDQAAAALAVVAPNPAVVPPTLSAAAATAAAAANNARTPAPAVTATLPATATPAAPLPDLVVVGATASGGKLMVLVRNQGKGALRGALTVTVVDLTSKKQVASGSLPNASIAAGATATIEVAYKLKGNDRLVVGVNSTAAESDVSNNTTTVALSFSSQ